MHGDIPALHRVALLAVGAHLPPVNIGVAVGAILPDIRKHRLHVALHAFHLLVHAAQRITGLVVIEFRHCFHRAPAGGRVAIFAGDVQWTVWVAAGFLLSGR